MMTFQSVRYLPKIASLSSLSKVLVLKLEQCIVLPSFPVFQSSILLSSDPKVFFKYL